MNGSPGIVIVDYGMGNLHSVRKAFEACGAPAAVSSEAGEIGCAAALVVPGVGAFGDCIESLSRSGLGEAIARFICSGRPYLGLCLGLQILFPSSEEAPEARGLGLIAGRVRKFACDRKVPHMGWNTLRFGGGEGGQRPQCPLFSGIADGAYAYFVHSYYPEPEDDAVVAATTEYGIRFASALWRGNIMATQFHPEKSQRVGLAMIRNFVAFAAGGARPA